MISKQPIVTLLVTAVVMAACICMPTESYAQDVWIKSAGIKAPANSRLVSNSAITLLYSPTNVFMSNNGGYVWWSVAESFPNGLVAACELPGKLVGLSLTVDGTVRMHSTTNNGATWLWKAAFTLDAGQELVELVGGGNQLVAYTKGGLVYTSSDAGASWRRFFVTSDVGELLDVATMNTSWFACGKQGTAWSTDDGATWSMSSIPFKIGGHLVALEASGGKVWGAGPFGMARFETSSMSWIPASNGLDNGGGIVPSAVDVKDLGGVLFGIFRESNNANRCFRWDGAQWRIVDNGGLPFGTQVGRFRFSICKSLLQVFVTGNDANLNGVYVVKHQSPTGVHEESGGTYSIHPNPARDVVQISGLAEHPVSIQVVDAMGMVVTSEIVQNNAQLNTAGIASGYYRLLITDGQTQFSQSLIIQH